MQQKLKEVLVPSVIASLASLLIYKYGIGDNLDIEVPLLGIDMPAYAAIGISTMLGNLGGEIISDLVKDKIPQPGFLKGIEDMTITPLISGLSTYTVMRFGVSEYTDFKNAVLATAGGSIIGKYAVKSM